MTDRSEHAILNRLIATCRDGERGFRLAAEQVTDPALKKLFAEVADQRATFATELVPHAQRLGGDSAPDGTVTAALHRVWMATQDRLHHDDEAIVGQVGLGDRSTLTTYYDAINGMLPPETRDLVERQFEELEATHARLPVHAPR